MAALTSYIAGDVWVTTATFTVTTTGAVVDPSTVKFVYSVAGGQEVEYTYGVSGLITRTGTGVYQVSTNTTGWATLTTGTVAVNYLWAGEGTGQGVNQGVILVEPPFASF